MIFTWQQCSGWCVEPLTEILIFGSMFLKEIIP